MGYVRKNGAIGIRNKVLVIYTVECASLCGQEIVRLAGDPETEVVGFSGRTDNEYAVRLLIALIRHPNVGRCADSRAGVRVSAAGMAGGHSREGGKGSRLDVHSAGGRNQKDHREGPGCCGLMRERLKDTKRKPMGIRDLIIGAECGGSDYTSGLAGNVVVGRFFDRLTDLGGTAIFEEIVEAIGLKEMLVGRAAK